MKETLIYGRNEDGTMYLSLGPKTSAVEWLDGDCNDWGGRSRGPAGHIVSWVFDRTEATRLNFHEATRIARRLNRKHERRGAPHSWRLWGIRPSPAGPKRERQRELSDD
jgi:hypothetical protein